MRCLAPLSGATTTTAASGGNREELLGPRPAIHKKRAFGLLHLDNLFDTLVTADRITQGKPDPMCYLLAAKDLNVSPEDCIVLEDSFNGIQSGKDAGMRVIGLSTTNPAESLRDKVYEVIPNFEKVTFEDYLRW